MKKSHKNNAFHLNWGSFNRALTTLEKQAGRCYTNFKHSLPHRWEKKLDQLTKQDYVKLAMRKRNQISKEVKFYTDGIVKTISHANVLPNKNRLVKLAKANGSKILGMLNFPTKKDVSRLNARLSQLEKRFQTLRNTPSQ